MNGSSNTSSAVTEELKQLARRGLVPGGKSAVSSSAPTTAPAYVSKKERERLALERVQQQREAEGTAKSQPVTRTNGSNGSTSSHSHQQSTDSHANLTPAERDIRERELHSLKAQHLGMQPTSSSYSSRSSKPTSAVTALAAKGGKQKVVHHGGHGGARTKFVFEWSNEEDTSAGNDLLLLQAEMEQERRKLQSGDVDSEHDDQRRNGRNGKRQAENGRHNDDDRNVRRRYEDVRDVRSLGHNRDVQPVKHWSEKPLQEMTERDWRILREDFEINIKGISRQQAPRPLRYWHESVLPPTLLHTLEQYKYTKPTPIQRSAIPVALSGEHDLVGLAETGSGKTLAFVLPMLVAIEKQLQRYTTPAEIRQSLQQNGPLALILAPTRELAQQIAEEALKFASAVHMQVASVVGGINIDEQTIAMREGVEIIVATPGRMNDCLERHYVVLHQCNYIVLDEADRMIDMNFEPQLKTILEAMPPATDRTTIMFSATMPAKVETLARTYMKQPTCIISVGDRRNKAAITVTQRVEWCSSDKVKRDKLVKVLQNDEPPFIVFANLRQTCDELGKLLTDEGFTNAILHGQMSQDRRTAALESFKNRDVDILIATDVAGRGIDIKDVAQVINYEMPNEIERYTHRIGRTGRAGRKGVATSFVSESDSGIFYDLKHMIEGAGQAVPREILQHDASKFQAPKKGSGSAPVKGHTPGMSAAPIE